MKLLLFISLVMFFAFQARSAELTVEVFDPQSQGVGDVVVYVRPIEAINNLPINANALLINQKDKKFSPYITVIQQGKAINFVNNDDITHHIYSVSGKNRFEFKIQAGVEKTTEPMEETGEVAMGCNIHDWMSGYTLVVDTPFYGKTNKSGKLTFALPFSGEYELIVWHPQLDVDGNRIANKVTVIENSHSKISITLPKNLLPLPQQTGQDEFDFIEEY